MDLSQEVNQNTYLHNGFRIFNLPITSSQRKVNKEFSKIENMKDLNGWDTREELDIYTNLPFPIIPKPNFINYQDAKNRLSNSKKRFIDELFWFWPADLNNKQDETIMALRNGDVDEALNIWQSSNSANASHNLAIYNHLLAVDKEVSGPNYAYKKYWREGLKYWQQTLSSNQFKNLALERVRSLNDATLKEDYVEEVFDQLPLAILSINAWFASSYLKKNDQKNFARHLDLIKESSFEQKIKDESIKGIFNSLYDPLNEKYQEFDTRVKNKEFTSASDVEKVEAFLEEVEGELELLKEHFSDNLQYQNLSGDIAQSIKNAYVSIINTENDNDNLDKIDFDRAERVFNKLKDMAYAFNVKKDIEENFKGLQRVNEGQKLDKTFNKIKRFLDEGENDSIYSAKQYAREVSSEIDKMESDAKDNISDGFAMSLRNYSVANAMKLQDHPDRFDDEIGDLLDLLRLAKRYAVDPELKENIDENISAIENSKSSGAENKVFEKIKRFLEEGENDSIYSAKRYANEVSAEIDRLDSPNKNTISDGFAISLKNYVVEKVNKLQTNPKELASSFDDLKYLLRMAKRYANDFDTLKNIEENLESLEKMENVIKILGDANVDFTVGTPPGSGGGTSGGSSGGSGGSKGCIIGILIILAAIAGFLYMSGII